MADTFKVILHGGKCNLDTPTVSADVIRSGKLWCQGELYVLVVSESSTSYPFQFVWAQDLGISASSKATVSATQAWSRWMHGLAHKGPHAHRRIRTATARVRRIAKHR